MNTRYCQFCRRSFEDPGTSARFGGRYFCQASHAMRFFKGEEFVVEESNPQPQPQTPPFPRLGKPKLLVPV